MAAIFLQLVASRFSFQSWRSYFVGESCMSLIVKQVHKHPRWFGTDPLVCLETVRAATARVRLERARMWGSGKRPSSAQRRTAHGSRGIPRGIVAATQRQRRGSRWHSRLQCAARHVRSCVAALGFPLLTRLRGVTNFNASIAFRCRRGTT